jgi:hypothetical protein
MRVVATLSPEGTFRMGETIGTGAIRVEGEVAEVSPQEWRLRMISVAMNDGREVGWNREPVAFPVGLIASVQERQFHRTKSWLTAGGVTAGVFILGRIFLRGVFESDDRTQPPPPPA